MLCANSPDRRDRICAVDRDAAPLHARQHRRPAAAPASRRRVVMPSATRRGLQHAPQPQRHVGVLGRVGGRLSIGDARRSRSKLLPVPATSLNCDRLVAEIALRRARPCRAAPDGRRRARRTSASCRRRARSSMPQLAEAPASRTSRSAPTLSTDGSSSSGFSRVERLARRASGRAAGRRRRTGRPPCRDAASGT